MKILYVTTVGGTMSFFVEHFRMLTNEGHTVEVACNLSSPVKNEILEMGIKSHDICFSRNPFSADNLNAYKDLKKLVIDGEYDIVHCHTPNAAAITRLACNNLRKKGLRVIYTAHGFHFYKGAPLKNWMIFYPVEWICAHLTDTLITINKEDYALAKKHMQAKSIEYIPGVGVDLKKFCTTNKMDENKRLSIGVPENAKMILSVGELNENKNHQIVIKALSQISNDDIHYVIAGEGPQKDDLLSLAGKLGISSRIHLLGFRDDVAELYSIADMYALPSIREGLNVSIMEAMSEELPCIVSRIRGNMDLIDDNGGALYNPLDCAEVRKSIEKILSMNSNEREQFGKYNKNKIFGFGSEVVIDKLNKIYEKYI